jgi:hypothetical protein
MSLFPFFHLSFPPPSLSHPLSRTYSPRRPAHLPSYPPSRPPSRPPFRPPSRPPFSGGRKQDRRDGSGRFKTCGSGAIAQFGKERRGRG